MQPITSYQPNLSVAVLIQGPPGSGKTTLACQFPRPYVLDCDLNMSGMIRYCKANNLQLPVGYDTVDIDEEGKPVGIIVAGQCEDKGQRYARLAAKLSAAAADPNIDTLIIDSVTKVSDYIIAEVMRQGQVSEMRIQDWGKYLYVWKTLITRVRQTRKISVWIGHERPDKDELDGIMRYFLNLPGQIASIFGGMVSDVWHTEVEEKLGKHSWLVRTLPNTRHSGLKHSIDLPPLSVVDSKIIAAALAKGA